MILILDSALKLERWNGHSHHRFGAKTRTGVQQYKGARQAGARQAGAAAVAAATGSGRQTDAEGPRFNGLRGRKQHAMPDGR